MLLRLIVTTGIFAVGYYLGREVGRNTPVRRELEQARARGNVTEVSGLAPEPDAANPEKSSSDDSA